MDRFKRQPAPDTAGRSLSSHTRLRIASAAGGGGELAPRYAMMREVLLRYLSPILVDSVLERSLAARGLTERALTNRELAEVASDIMVGLRLFVREDRLPLLMLDLAEMLEAD
jgi:hypothetical protein